MPYYEYFDEANEASDEENNKNTVSKRKTKQENKNQKRLQYLLESYRKNDDRFRLIDSDHIIKYINSDEPNSFYESKEVDETIENFIYDVTGIYPQMNSKVLLNILVNRFRKYYVGYV
jgi:hypothetical protein